MKKIKQPGDNISLKTKKNEPAAIIDWINSQSNLMDSIRYLIENEISAKGIRNLQNFIPAERGPSFAAGLQAVNASQQTLEQVAATIEDDIDDEDIDAWS